MKHKFLSVLLCLCMVLTMAPSAFAEEYTPDEPILDESILNENAGVMVLELDEEITPEPTPEPAPAPAADGSETNPYIIEASTSALENGKYYKLAGDVTLTAPIVVNDGVTAHIDLASGTLTGVAGTSYIIQVKKGGTLTVTGTAGTVQGVKHGALINSGGTVTINGGTFTSGWRISVKNEEKGETAGTMTITGGTFICNKQPVDQAVQNFCTLSITGGTFTGKVVTWQEVGTGYADYGETTITGGTFNDDILIATTKADQNADTSKKPSLSISGEDTVINANVGFFKGNDDAKAPAEVDGTLTISGVTVDGDVYNGSKGTIAIENATITGSVTNKGDESDAGSGSVSISGSIIEGGVDESVDRNDIINCVDGEGDVIGTKYTVTVVGSVPATVGPTDPEKGTEVTVTPSSANTGWRYDIVVKDADGNAVTVTDGKFTMPAGNVTVELTAVKTYTVTVDSSIPAGQGSASCDITTAAAGDTVTFTVTPVDGYQVRYAYYHTEAGDVQATPVEGEENTYSFAMPAENVTIRVMFWGAEAACVYSNSGVFQGKLTFSGLASEETNYVVQVAKLVNGSANGAHAIMFFTSSSGSATVDVLGNPGGYKVELYMYPDGASDISDLVRVPVSVSIATE